MRRACGCDPLRKVYCAEGAKRHAFIRKAYNGLVESIDDKYRSSRREWEKAYAKARAEWLAHLDANEEGAA